MAKSKFWRLIGGYDTSGGESVGKSFTDLSYSGAVNQRIKRSLIFRLMSLAGRVSNLFSSTSTKSYGALSLSFGILTLVFHFSGEYLGVYNNAGAAALVIGIVFSMLSIPLLLIDKPISMFLQDFALTDLFLFELLCIKRSNRAEGARSIHPTAAVCLGMLPAILGLFIPLQNLLALVGVLTFVCIAFVSPEFSYITTLLVLPYISYLPYAEYVLFGVIIVTLASFLKKVAYGKRVLHIEQYDLLIGLFMLAVLISGIFVKGIDSFTGSLSMLGLSFGYLLTSNIVANRRLADRVTGALVLSSLPAAANSVYQALAAIFSGEASWVFTVGVGSSFGEPLAYAAYLIVVIPFVAMRIAETRGAVRFLYLLLLILNTGALVFTAQRFAWLVLLIGVFLFFGYRARYAAPFFVFMLIALPYALILLFGDAVAVIFTTSDTDLLPSRIGELWQAALEVLSKNLFVGIGIGESCFAEEFLPLGFEGIGNSHNFFIELGLEAGIFALAAVLLLLVARFRHRATYRRYLDESEMSLVSTVAAVATSSLIVFGTTYYLFENMEISYLFWFVFGLGSAALRIAKRERDDKILYYEDTKSPDFSVAEVKIK